jgi:hypothetical protein
MTFFKETEKTLKFTWKHTHTHTHTMNNHNKLGGSILEASYFKREIRGGSLTLALVIF